MFPRGYRAQTALLYYSPTVTALQSLLWCVWDFEAEVLYPIKSVVYLFKNHHFFVNFENALVPQPVDGLIFPTPEMKDRDAYVPFLHE